MTTLMDSVHNQKKLPMPALEKKMKKFFKRFEQDCIKRDLIEFSGDNAYLLPAGFVTQFLLAIEEKNALGDLSLAKDLMWKVSQNWGTLRTYYDYVEGLKFLFAQKESRIPENAKAAERIFVEKKRKSQGF